MKHQLHLHRRCSPPGQHGQLWAQLLSNFVNAYFSLKRPHLPVSSKLHSSQFADDMRARLIFGTQDMPLARRCFVMDCQG